MSPPTVISSEVRPKSHVQMEGRDHAMQALEAASMEVILQLFVAGTTARRLDIPIMRTPSKEPVEATRGEVMKAMVFPPRLLNSLQILIPIELTFYEFLNSFTLCTKQNSFSFLFLFTSNALPKGFWGFGVLGFWDTF